MASFLSSSLKTGRLISMWCQGSWQCWPQCWCLEPPDLSDLDDTLKHVVWWRWRCQGWGSPRFSLLLATVLALLWCTASFMVWHLMSMPQTSQHSSALWSLSSCGGLSWLQKLNSGNTDSHEQGCLGPLASMHHSMMAWVINCWPSHKLTALVLSWACLLTQLMAPDNVNMVSCPLLKLSPSPRDCLP